ncbi:helix-turn-helix transcriptional regulator [Bradyrhizobium sp. RT10b]|uniref:helix-turn-helix domain-containing protein n=1 Tax=Bradyrhizobium sp. RT10b TaxID=3156331 RepID=UPI00339898EB
MPRTRKTKNLYSQGSKQFGYDIKAHQGIVPGMVNKPASGANKPIPKRLRTLRIAEGYETALSFANHLGISPARYGNIEAGSNLSIEVAQLIVKKVPGASLDWLYNGKEEALPLGLRQRLGSVEAETGNIRTSPASRTKTGSPSGRRSSAK